MKKEKESKHFIKIINQPTIYLFLNTPLATQLNFVKAEFKLAKYRIQIVSAMMCSNLHAL